MEDLFWGVFRICIVAIALIAYGSFHHQVATNAAEKRGIDHTVATEMFVPAFIAAFFVTTWFFNGSGCAS